MAVALAPAIVAWLRRAAGDERLAVRGSVVLAALSGRARPPVDVDHLLLGDGATLEEAEARLRAIAGEAPVSNVEVLWPDSPAPGVRALVGGLQIDIAIREPLEAAPHAREVPGVGAVTCAAIEDLCAWKIHGLVEFGHGQWRPKDVYDLDVLAEVMARTACDRSLVRRAVERAFASRAAQVPLLDDFLDRATWGESTSGRKRWRAFARSFPGAGDFPPLRDRVRAFVASIVR